MGSPAEIILTIIVLSFWFIFPIGMFLSVSHVDKNTDQIVQLGHRRHFSTDSSEQKEAAIHREEAIRIPVKIQRRPPKQRVSITFRRWVRHH